MIIKDSDFMPYRNMADWELKAIKKALSLPISSFLNDENDEKRLYIVKEVLKYRKAVNND